MFLIRLGIQIVVRPARNLRQSIKGETAVHRMFPDGHAFVTHGGSTVRIAGYQHIILGSLIFPVSHTFSTTSISSILNFPVGHAFLALRRCRQSSDSSK